MSIIYTNTDYRFTCEEAVRVFGETPQLMMLIEEMSELTQAISKHFRGKGNKENIAEEIADVEIMLTQAKMIFDNEDICNIYSDKKISRLRETLDNVTNI